MRIRFQADANLDPDIGRGLRRRESLIDFRDAALIPDGMPDIDVLQISAEAGRVLVTRDVRTMWAHFEEFIAAQDSPGVILVPASRSTGSAIEGLLAVWLSWGPEELRNQVRWLP